jgi:hypothetical protein
MIRTARRLSTRFSKISKRSSFLLVIPLFLVIHANKATAEDKQFQWSAGISLSEEYDDNINLEPDNEQHDWITLISPRFNATLKTEETEISLDYDLGISLYASNDQNNTARHYLSLTGFKGVPIVEDVTLDLDAVFIVSEDPIEISDYVTSVRQTRDRYYRNTAGGRINYHFGEEDTFYVGFHHILLVNDDPDVEDSEKFQPAAGITYWFNIHHGLSFDYAFVRGDFEISEEFNEHVGTATYTYRFSPGTKTFLSYKYDEFDYVGIKEDYVVHDAKLGFTHQLTESFLATLSGGYFLQDREQSGDTSRFTGNAAIDSRFRFEKSSLILDAETGYRQQFFEAENLGFTIFYRTSVAFVYSFTENLAADLSGFYQFDDFQETTPDREDQNWGGQAALNWKVWRWLTASLSYAYRERNSTIDENDFTDNRVTLTLVSPLYESKPYPF